MLIVLSVYLTVAVWVVFALSVVCDVPFCFSVTKYAARVIRSPELLKIRMDFEQFSYEFRRKK